MELMDNIKQRRSIRKYLDIPLEWEKISAMIDAARCAPTAGNLQTWKFVVVVNKDSITKIADAALQQVWIDAAPCVIVVCSEVNRQARHYGTRGESMYSIQEAAAATENMILAANEQGLGTCWVGAFEENELRRILDIPEHVKPMIIVTVGYPDESVPSPPKFKLDDVIYFEKYGNKVRMEGQWPLGKHIEKGKQAIKIYTQKMLDKLKESMPKKEENQEEKQEKTKKEAKKEEKTEEKKEEKKKNEVFGVPSADDLRRILGK